jgi:hypothetical protein
MSLKTKITLSETEQWHNTTGMAIGATRSLELLIKEFQSIFTF